MCAKCIYLVTYIDSQPSTYTTYVRYNNVSYMGIHVPDAHNSENMNSCAHGGDEL